MADMVERAAINVIISLLIAIVLVHAPSFLVAEYADGVKQITHVPERVRVVSPVFLSSEKGDYLIWFTSLTVDDVTPELIVTPLAPEAYPHAVATPITLSATPTGGAHVEYQFLVDDGSGWVALGEYTPAATCLWTPTVADTYQLKVMAREVGTAENVMDEAPYAVTP